MPLALDPVDGALQLWFLLFPPWRVARETLIRTLKQHDATPATTNNTQTNNNDHEHHNHNNSYDVGDGGGDGTRYNGGREYDDLKKFVQDTLEPKCSVQEQDGCSAQEKEYIAKMQAEGAEAIAKQLARMEGMKAKPMKPELKAWVNTRARLLSQM